MKKGTTVNLGDSAQTTPREASLDPSKDNLNALKNAHLTPAAIRRVQAGKSINPPEKPEESTTPALKSKPKAPSKAPTSVSKPSVTKTEYVSPKKEKRQARRSKQRANRKLNKVKPTKTRKTKAPMEPSPGDLVAAEWLAAKSLMI